MMKRFAALALLLLVAACTSSGNKNPSLTEETSTSTGAINVVQGSEQDFMVNVGRRTFFTQGSAALDDTARATRNPERAMEKFAAAIPLGRLGRREEVAALCVYLLSDEAGFITGADYPIDGGLTAQ